MGATLDETRLELEAQRARVRGTAERLETTTRQSLDVRALIGRHPGRTVGLAAGAAFFLLGGPHRTVRLVRRAFGAAADGEKAYAALPLSLRTLVDEVAPGFGAAKTEAKGEMALALHAWRENPKNRKNADRLISETLTPPGPTRAFWALVEVAGVTAAGIIAKQIVGRRLAGGAASSLFGTRGSTAGTPPPPATTRPASPAGPMATGATKPAGTPKSATEPAPSGYSGWSGRQASVTGPARDAAPPAKTRTGTTKT